MASCVWRGKLKLNLVVYFDDFKMAGPEKPLAKGWELITSKLETGEVTKGGQYVGSDHRISKEKDNSKGVTVITYDMTDFMSQCVNKYCHLAGVEKSSLRNEFTPFVEVDDVLDDPEGNPVKLADVSLKVFMNI